MDSAVFTGRKRVVMSVSEMIGARKESAFSPKHHFGQRRTHHDCYVELDGIQGDGVGHVVLLDEGGNQRLVGGTSEGLRETGNEREAKNVPDVDMARRHENGEDAGCRHLDILRAEQNFSALHAIGDHAADQRE
jgi:hypothetical protein